MHRKRYYLSMKRDSEETSDVLLPLESGPIFQPEPTKESSSPRKADLVEGPFCHKKKRLCRINWISTNQLCPGLIGGNR